MKSPFPGMDPYLEARWSDVHGRLIGLISEAIQPNLPRALRARMEERVLLETVDQEPLGAYRPDIAVVQTGRDPLGRPAGADAVATVEPVAIEFYDAPQVDRFIHIVDATSGNRVVTAIEVLSPWNKGPGQGNKEYRRKIDDYARADVSVVEIDLLREPARGRLRVTEAEIPADRRAPYVVCVCFQQNPSRWYAYPMSIRQPLPRIPIPLRATDPTIGLDLQPLIEHAYIAGGHDDIDYTRPADPPLRGDDAVWADQLLKAAGRR
jgi:hypothetical protein